MSSNSNTYSNDLAWAAGFVDGEGCITIARQRFKGRNNISHRLKFSIAQNNFKVLKKVELILNESCFISEIRRTGAMNRDAYVLVYDSGHALRALEKLEPYLQRKQHEARAVREMWIDGKMGKRPGPKGWPEEIYKIREKWARKISRLK